MSAPFTKDQLAFSLGRQSYIGPSYEDGGAPAVKPQRHGALSAVLARFAAWRRRRQVAEEMMMMSDRELSDIGLSRSDLSRVFDPGFAADHLRGRDYIAY